MKEKKGSEEREREGGQWRVGNNNSTSDNKKKKINNNNNNSSSIEVDTLG